MSTAPTIQHLTLAQLLIETDDYLYSSPTVTGDSFAPAESVQVFSRDTRYFCLSDYIVWSAESGPSLILAPRKERTTVQERWEAFRASMQA